MKYIYILLIYLIYVNECCDSFSNSFSIEKGVVKDEIKTDRLLMLSSQNYDIYHTIIYEHLVNLGAEARKVVFNDANGPLENIDDLDVYDQIWILDLNTGIHPSTEELYDRIAEWWLRKQSKNIIYDGRIHFMAYPSLEDQLVHNYYFNLMIRGGGLIIGADHYQDYTYGARYISRILNFYSFIDDTLGANPPNNRTEVEPFHPLLHTPAYSSHTDLPNPPIDGYFIRSLYDCGLPPSGDQPNGIYLHTFGWTNQKDPINGYASVTTSIPPSDFYFIKEEFECDQILSTNDLINIGHIDVYNESTIHTLQLKANDSLKYETRVIENGEPILINGPKIPGLHDIEVTISSSNDQIVRYKGLSIEITLEDGEYECNNDVCECVDSTQCNIRETFNIINIVNHGYTVIESSSHIIVSLDDTYNHVIDTKDGFIDIKGGEITINISTEIDEDGETTIKLLKGLYRGKFDKINVVSPMNESSCKSLEVKEDYRRVNLDLIVSVKDECSKIKAWMIVLIVLGCIIVSVAALLAYYFGYRRRVLKIKR